MLHVRTSTALWSEEKNDREKRRRKEGREKEIEWRRAKKRVDSEKKCEHMKEIERKIKYNHFGLV